MVKVADRRPASSVLPLEVAVGLHTTAQNNRLASVRGNCDCANVLAVKREGGGGDIVEVFTGQK